MNHSRVQRRTIEYARDGIYVLWLLQWTPKLDAGRYAQRLWEKWVHAAYFGRVYYWLKGLEVVSYLLDSDKLLSPKFPTFRFEPDPQGNSCSRS